MPRYHGAETMSRLPSLNFWPPQSVNIRKWFIYATSCWVACYAAVATTKRNLFKNSMSLRSCYFGGKLPKTLYIILFIFFLFDIFQISHNENANFKWFILCWSLNLTDLCVTLSLDFTGKMRLPSSYGEADGPADPRGFWCLFQEGASPGHWPPPLTVLSEAQPASERGEDEQGPGSLTTFQDWLSPTYTHSSITRKGAGIMGQMGPRYPPRHWTLKLNVKWSFTLKEKYLILKHLKLPTFSHVWPTAQQKMATSYGSAESQKDIFQALTKCWGRC